MGHLPFSKGVGVVPCCTTDQNASPFPIKKEDSSKNHRPSLLTGKMWPRPTIPPSRKLRCKAARRRRGRRAGNVFFVDLFLWGRRGCFGKDFSSSRLKGRLLWHHNFSRLFFLLKHRGPRTQGGFFEPRFETLY